ncbi:MAG TPA: hypothetical protein VGZ25_07095, partial [Gemmataceae bacterium]|nr:hypothetical protein [Gemmataceae bacterium]
VARIDEIKHSVFGRATGPYELELYVFESDIRHRVRDQGLPVRIEGAGGHIYDSDLDPGIKRVEKRALKLHLQIGKRLCHIALGVDVKGNNLLFWIFVIAIHDFCFAP